MRFRNKTIMTIVVTAALASIAGIFLTCQEIVPWPDAVTLLAGIVAAGFAVATFVVMTKEPALTLLFMDKPVKTTKVLRVPWAAEYELPLGIRNIGNKSITEPYYLYIKFPPDLLVEGRGVTRRQKGTLITAVDPPLWPGSQSGEFYGWLETVIFPKSSLKLGQMYAKLPADGGSYQIRYSLIWAEGSEEGEFELVVTPEESGS